MSKGSGRRPESEGSFNDNYEGIFGGKKPTRGSFVYDPVSKAMVSKEDYQELREINAPMVMNDISGYKSMQTGEWINSRSHHRDHLKQHRLIELGNEKIPAPKEHKYDSQAVKRELAKHFH
jgi:hypothetical protein